MTLIRALREFILRNARNRRQPEHLKSEFPDLFRHQCSSTTASLSRGLESLPSERKDRLEQAPIAVWLDLLEGDERPSECSVGLHVSRKVLDRMMYRRRRRN